MPALDVLRMCGGHAFNGLIHQEIVLSFCLPSLHPSCDYAIACTDTAGIRDSMDAVEKIGVERSRRAAVATDVVIMVVDAQVRDTIPHSAG